MPKTKVKTKNIDSYKVSASASYTYLHVEVGGKNYRISTSNSNPTPFPMAAITCLKDAFLQRKKVTVDGKMSKFQIGTSAMPLRLTLFELHK